MSRCDGSCVPRRRSETGRCDLKRFISTLPSATPPGVRRLLQRCLVKDSKHRVRDIGDTHADLDDALPMAGAAGATRRATILQHALQWGLALAVGIGSGGLTMWWLRPAPAQDRAPFFSRAFRLTTTPAHEFGPAISPDGKWVAYLSDARGPTDVWVKFIAGGEPANLTASAPLDIQVRSAIGGLDISPNGSSIAVQARPRGSSAPTFDTWLIPAPLGGTPRRFVETQLVALGEPKSMDGRPRRIKQSPTHIGRGAGGAAVVFA
jgi:hypothetical protein